MKIFHLFLGMVFFVFLANAQPFPEKAPVDPDFRLTAGEIKEMKDHGIILPPLKPLHNPWVNLRALTARYFPPLYDLRQTPWLTSVKTQSPGGCWAYSVMGAVESRLLMLGMDEYDLSDNNLKFCHKYLPERSTNGNHWMATSYFARRSGPFSESQDPYPGGTTGPENCPNDITPLFYIPQARYTPPQNELFTKQTLLDNGPLWTLLYYKSDYFNSTSFTYFYGGNHSVNHAGVIVGWNDTLATAGGTGAWIVKNTYGPNWGDNGYYYVAYQDAQILKYNGYWPEMMPYEPDAHLYQYDEIGGYWGVGFGNEIGFGLVKYEGVEGLTEILSIGTFVLYAGSGVEISIYDTFDGQLSGLLFSMNEILCDLPGYYTFEMDSSLFIPQGQTFYILVKYNSHYPAGQWPIPVEDTIPGYSTPALESGVNWIAPDPYTWPAAWYQTGLGTPFPYDLCIKAYSEKWPLPPVPQVFAGIDDTIVQGAGFSPDGTNVQNASAVHWSTTGDGIFDDPANLHAFYFPGEEDIDNGNVQLILKAFWMPPVSGFVADTLSLTILRPPAVSILFPENQQKICFSQLETAGFASDADNDLIEVELSVNNGNWETASGLASWTFTVELQPGVNALKARSLDAAGLVSAIAEISVLYSVQNIFLPAGWSLVSGFLIPDESNVEMLLEEITDNLVVIQNQGGMYAPFLNTNTLDNWNSGTGYKVKMLDDDLLTFCGDVPDNNQFVAQAGFHMIPYLSNAPASIAQIFTDPFTDVLYLFDMNEGRIFWPEGEIFTLEQLKPGSGYLAFFINDVTLYFPPFQDFSFDCKVFENTENNLYPKYFATGGRYHLLSVSAKALENLSDGYLYASGTTEFCFAKIEINEDIVENQLLVVYEDDPLTPVKDGAVEGEQLRFFYSETNGQSQEEMLASFDPALPDEGGYFVPDGLSRVISLFAVNSQGNLISSANAVSITPNPASTAVMIEHQTGILTQIELLSLQGKTLRQLTTCGRQVSLDISGITPGLYFVRAITDGDVYTARLIVR